MHHELLDCTPCGHREEVPAAETEVLPVRGARRGHARDAGEVCMAAVEAPERGLRGVALAQA